MTPASRGAQASDLCFLDANVLFSAAYRPDTPLRELWNLPNVQLMTSTYAAVEAQRNLRQNAQRLELQRLLTQMHIVVDDAQHMHPAVDQIELADKDKPILSSALRAGATHLLTGDRKHFGACYGTRVESVLILRPADYLRSKLSPPE